jgi:hypothetical protein
MMSVRSRNPFQSPDIIVKPAKSHEFILVGQPTFDTERPREDRLRLFQALFLKRCRASPRLRYVCRDTTYSTRSYYSRALRPFSSTWKKCKITWSALTQPLHFPAPPRATPSKPKRPKKNAIPHACQAAQLYRVPAPQLSPLGSQRARSPLRGITTTHRHHASGHRPIHRRKSAPQRGDGGDGRNLQRWQIFRYASSPYAPC